jgi:ATP-dependent Lon protease
VVACLPIGGLKEKLLAALRGGIQIVLIPKENEKDLADIPDRIKQGLDIRPVDWIDEVLDIALVGAPAGEGLPSSSGGGDDAENTVRPH